jgi:predicted GTPase
MASEDLATHRGSQMGSRLSAILQELQKRQATETPPPLGKQKSRKRSLMTEVVVAVMGVTGAGKSSFIRRVTENEEVHVGGGLQSSKNIPPQ